MKQKRMLLLVLVGFVSFLSGGWLLQRGTERAGNVYDKARLFDDVLGYVAEYYVDSIGEARLYDLAIDGMLNELGDPYTSFLRREDVAELRESTTGNYGGLGIRIDVRDGWITVIAPIANTPADDAGLETGDRIVEVDGRSTFGWKNEKAVDELRGPAGSKVRLTVARPGLPEPFELTIERADIHIKAIQLSTMLGGDVGYVSLVNSSVSETLPDELAQEIAGLRARGARALILDLRYNPGGLLDQGVEVADLFLEPGQVVVATRGRGRGSSATYRAERPQRWAGMPIVVLVNQGTASASEIIAGALQDHDRALVVGTPTFGKGLVQSVLRLRPDEWLRITTARWYTPSGRTIQRDRTTGDTGAVAVAGEEPDELPSPDSSAVYHTDAGRIVYGGGGIHPDLVIRPETLTTAEQGFVKALGSKFPVYRDVMTSFALELKGRNRIARPFRVTDVMRAELLGQLRARDVDVSDDLWAGARELVSEQLAYEIERYVFGREAELLRRIDDDPQVQKALGLLREVHTPGELLALASAEAEAKAARMP